MISQMICQRWPKAFIVSFTFHIVTLCTIGFFGSSLFAAPPVIEQIIELDLAHGQPAASPAMALAAAIPTPQPTPPLTETITEPAPVASVPSDATLSIDTAENSSTAAIGNTGPASAASGEGSSSSNSISGSIERGSIAPPRILSKTEPDYPSAARQAGLEGTVILKVQIFENGRPGDIDIYRSSGHAALDNAAVAAVRKWRFTPAKDLNSGRSVPCITTLPVVFLLQ